MNGELFRCRLIIALGRSPFLLRPDKSEETGACQLVDVVIKLRRIFVLTNARPASLFAVHRQKRAANADAMDRLTLEPVPARAKHTTRRPAFSEPRPDYDSKRIRFIG